MAPPSKCYICYFVLSKHKYTAQYETRLDKGHEDASWYQALRCGEECGTKTKKFSTNSHSLRLGIACLK